MKSARSLWEQRDFSHSWLCGSGRRGWKRKHKKSRNRGCWGHGLRPWNLSPQCYYCTSAEKRSQTGAAARGAPSLSWRLLQSLWFWKLTEACVLLCRSRRGETEQWLSSSRMASDVGRSTWGQPLTQRTVFILPSGPPGKFLLKSSEVIIMMWSDFAWNNTDELSIFMCL